MCGLAGLVSWRGLSADDGQFLNQALNEIESRGPDGRGTWHDAHCQLGHLRLAIIDLSDRAAQPMHSIDGRYTIVFNGEIYNYQALRAQLNEGWRWQSDSDTEVILAAFLRWGADCTRRLRGMFAFAIWDSAKQRLFVARDRLGVKPLYYHAHAERFAFASRPRALFKLLPTLSKAADQQALRWYLEGGYTPTPSTCYRDVQKLDPGCYAEIDVKGVKVSRYWSLDDIATDTTLERADEEELLDELDRLVDESVRLRLVSNVPVGAFLSGGIDSSLVVAYMRKHVGVPVKTFTIGFNDSQFDESRHAQEVADYLGTEHTRQLMEPQDLLALMPQYLEQFDEPFFDYSAFPVMAVSRLARQHVTVSLSGDGGDEAFGGYHYYHLAQQFARARHIPQGLRRALAFILARLPGHKSSLAAGALCAQNGPQAFAFMRSVIKDFAHVIAPDLRATTRSLGDLFEARSCRLPANLSAAEQAMRLDLSYTLTDDYLQKVDVGSMAFSLEARDPLLDHVLIEWAARLPLKWKLRGRDNKYLLRRLAYRHIPRKILDRPKMGFGVPMARWLRNELKEWAEELLHDRAAMTALGLNAQAVNDVWQQHQARRRDAQSCLWTVLVLLQFYRKGALQ